MSQLPPKPPKAPVPHRSGAPAPDGAIEAAVGLCATCAHRQLVPNTRGSVFWLCRRSRSDRRYPRYPRLPVLACAGYERAAGVEREADAEHGSHGGA